MGKAFLYFTLIILSASARAELEVITLQHRSAEDILPIVRPLLEKGGVASGMNNQLILRTSRHNLQEIRELLPSIDTLPRQLRITVMQNVDGDTARRLVEMSGSVGLGRNARLTVPGTPDNAGLTVEAGQGADNVRARVLSTRSLENDRNTQKIQVTEGGRALISVGQSVPVQQRQIVQSPWGTQVTDSTQYRDVTSGFYVRPLLNGDRVTLEITAQNDSLAPGQASPPLARIQQVNTTLSGRLGEWMMLGDSSRQTADDGSTISSRSIADVNERRNVLLKVEEVH